MFESKNGSQYTVANNLTQSIFEWKEYSQIINYNQHGFLELQMNLSDVDLQGTENFNLPMIQTINRFQIRLNQTKIELDSY